MVKDIWNLIKETFSEWSEDKASRLAAALSYYTLFSLAPLLIIVIALASLIWGEEAARGRINNQIDGLLGEQGAEAIEDLIQGASREEEAGVVATVLGIATLVFGATGVFGQLYDSLNTIWEVYPIKGGILNTIQKKFLSFTMVLGIGFMLLVSLVISAALSALGEYTSNILPLHELILKVLNIVISFGIVTLLFAMMYRYVPEATIHWRDVWIGAAITALLFTIGKSLIGLYLGNSAKVAAFGPAGSIVLIMLWVYYSAQILFLGAEFTQVYARAHGRGIVPDDDAIRIPDVSSLKEAAQEAARRHGPAASPQEVARTAVALADRQVQQEKVYFIKERVPQDAGPFTAAFLAFTTFAAGIFLGLIRGSKEEKV